MALCRFTRLTDVFQDGATFVHLLIKLLVSHPLKLFTLFGISAKEFPGSKDFARSYLHLVECIKDGQTTIIKEAFRLKCLFIFRQRSSIGRHES
jgi:hypothetical protein